MQKQFNLIISCPRFHEKDAIAEISYLLLNIGDENAKGEHTNFPGLITALTNQDPLEGIKKLRNIIKNDPFLLRFVLKIVPIEIITESTMDKITQITARFVNRISETETFRITVKSRFSPLNTQELIQQVGGYINRKVNLTTPDRIVMIQILGNITGLSLLRSEDILSKAELGL